MTEETKDKIKIAHSKFRQLANIPSDQRNYQWNRELYATLPDCYFEIMGDMKDPNGTPYMGVTLASNEKIDHFFSGKPPTSSEDHATIHDIANTVRYSLERVCGMAIFSGKESKQPDATLRLGSLWSYHEYGHLGGCANCVHDFEKAFAINPDAPFDVVISNSTQYTIGQPSTAFFPDYVKDLMTEAIHTALPDAHPGFSLLNQEQYAIPMSILVQLNCGHVETDVLAHIQDMLVWLMPPYLPVSLNS